MAGTFADQAALAANSDFVNKCRAAMIKQAFAVVDANTQPLWLRNKMSAIINSAASDATNMAWRVASGNSTIAAAAPAVPTDNDTQFAVNTFLAQG